MKTVVPPLAPGRYLDSIATDGAAIGRCCRRHPDGTVPTCPDWTGADLLAHLTSFAVWVGDLHAARTGLGDPLPVVDPASAARDWDTTLERLIAVLRGADPHDPLPNWSTGPQLAAFWLRRAAQDVAIHRYDAALLETSTPAPVPTDIAQDGINEYLDVFVTTALATGAAPPTEATLALEVTDLAHTITQDLPHPGPVTTLRGTASELLLALWHRHDPLRLFVDGDRALVAAWPHI
jgi:uncharacterized protein (TIGR03083 family)